METVRILIYTDYEEINEDPHLYSWGLTELKKFVPYKTHNIAQFNIDLQHRFASKLKPQRLTRDFLLPYHQLWVLGFNTVREPPYELDAEEIDALEDWMNKGGGLLVAGDHAAGLCDQGDLQTFGAHGRSLGEPMKRAGQLRVWQGPPTACVDKPLKDRDNFNTCEGDDPDKLDLSEFQSDGEALKLLSLPGPPHRLFWFGKDAQGNLTLIQRFPDHAHESKLVIPKQLNGEWPPKSPMPVIAAMARDKRFPKEQRDYPVVVAFDGDTVDVGRIVADSSFHHYLNINLSGLLERDGTGYPVPGSDLDQIAQFYGNLALWLTPKTLRANIKSDLFFRLAVDPDVFEVRGTGVMNLGRVARYALALRFGEADLHRLVAVTEHEGKFHSFSELVAAISLGSPSSAVLSESEQAISLGAVIEAHHNYFEERGAVTPYWLEEKPEPLAMIKNGISLVQAVEPSLGDKLLPLFERAVADLAAE
jgi:hypothetical protein